MNIIKANSNGEGHRSKQQWWRTSRKKMMVKNIEANNKMWRTLKQTIFVKNIGANNSSEIHQSSHARTRAYLFLVLQIHGTTTAQKCIFSPQCHISHLLSRLRHTRTHVHASMALSLQSAITLMQRHTHTPARIHAFLAQPHIMHKCKRAHACARRANKVASSRSSILAK